MGVVLRQAWSES